MSDAFAVDGSVDAAVLYDWGGCSPLADGEGFRAGASVRVGSWQGDDVARRMVCSLSNYGAERQ